MSTLAHTPYDGSTKPFTIGLKPLDLATWIEIDEHLPAYLAEKAVLNRALPDKVFAAEADTDAAQAEVLHLLLEHLLAFYPDRYRREGETVHLRATGTTIDLGRSAPLLAAAALVQEDLVLMRRGDDGWRLAAASLCFPSSWNLRDKFGRTLTAIHDPVPDFGAGSRADGLINRMFDKLQPANPVQRWNWSLQPDAERHKPLSDSLVSHKGVRRFPSDDTAASTFIRVERQTLRKLPASGDILFTIRIYVDPVAVLSRDADCSALAASFAEQLSALDTAQLDYKGLSADRDQLVTMLERLGR